MTTEYGRYDVDAKLRAVRTRAALRAGRFRTCEGKVAHPNEAEADDEAKRVERTSGKPMSAYPCPFCK